MDKKQSDGAAWKKVINTKNGQVEILSIQIGDKRYTAWPNTFKKEGEKSPDYRLNLDKPREGTVELNKENMNKVLDGDLPF